MNYFINPELTVFFASMLPLVEARAAIPFGVFVLGISASRAAFLGILGGLLTVLIIAPLLYRFGDTSLWTRIPRVARLFDRLFAWTRRRHEARFSKRAKTFALFLFVAVLWPLTGVWSGMLAGFVFGLPLRNTMLACALGSIVSALIVTLSIVGIGAI